MSREQTFDRTHWDELMRAALAGDSGKYRELLSELASVLAGFLRARGADDSQVDDLTQDILISIHLSRESYDPSKPFGPWFFAIARRRFIDHLRSCRRELNRAAVNRELAALEEAQRSLEGRDELMDAAKLLKTLPDKQRTALELTKVQGLSVEEAARQSGLSESAVKVYTHRAVRQLNTKLKT